MSASTSGSPEVLLIEDNAGDVRLLEEAFKEAEFDCNLRVIRDGEQALAFLKRTGTYAKSPRPKLVLLDLNLPRKGGREVLAEMKTERSLRSIPVVVLSTSANSEDIDAAYSLHANCYIVKPEDMDSLVRLSKLLQSFWLRAVRLPA